MYNYLPLMFWLACGVIGMIWHLRSEEASAPKIPSGDITLEMFSAGLLYVLLWLFFGPILLGTFMLQKYEHVVIFRRKK